MRKGFKASPKTKEVLLEIIKHRGSCLTVMPPEYDCHKDCPMSCTESLEYKDFLYGAGNSKEDLAKLHWHKKREAIEVYATLYDKTELFEELI